MVYSSANYIIFPSYDKRCFHDFFCIAAAADMLKASSSLCCMFDPYYIKIPIKDYKFKKWLDVRNKYAEKVIRFVVHCVTLDFATY